MRRSLYFLAVLLVAASFLTAENATLSNTDSMVPELMALHEVIAPIWHNAYPNKDYAALRNFLPEINRLFAKLESAKLPGILREKQGAWNEKLAELKKVVEAYNKAAAGTDDPALLEAAEALHGGWERMMRLIRPVTREIDAFHKVLYVVYHDYLPGKLYEKIKGSVADLKVKAAAVVEAKLPARLQEKEAAYQKAAKALVLEVDNLESACASGKDDSIEKAVEAVHTAFKGMEEIF